MIGRFSESGLKAFVQSPLKARQTGASPGAFIFQYLASQRAWHNTDSTPWGWPAHPGQNATDTFSDPGDAAFIPKPVGAFGDTIERFVSFPNALAPTRIDLSQGSPAMRSGSGWTIDGHVYTILLAQKVGINMLEFTDPIYSIDWEPHIWDDIVQRIKVYEPANGIATYHTLPRTALTYMSFASLGNTGLNGVVTFPAPHRTESRDVGDSPTVYEPDTPVYSDLDPTDPAGMTTGTFEVVLFWFGLTADDLPSFPHDINLDLL